MVVIGCSKSGKLAKAVAKEIKDSYSDLEVKHFPDGEIYVKFPVSLKGKKVILVQSLHEPNESLLELLFAAHTAKDLGAEKVILVIPYLAYMRQDKMFNPGECVSSKVVAKLLNVADELITVDPHLHRYKNLNELFGIKAKRLTANKLIADYIKKHYKKTFIVGPDVESYQWAEDIAKRIGLHATVMTKKRLGSRKVVVKMKKDVDVKTRDVVIVDDIISSGYTMIETVKQIKRLNPKNIYCICVHGIFAENALAKLKKAGAKEVISTNTIQTKTSKIDVAVLIADALRNS